MSQPPQVTLLSERAPESLFKRASFGDLCELSELFMDVLKYGPVRVNLYVCEKSGRSQGVAQVLDISESDERDRERASENPGSSEEV